MEDLTEEEFEAKCDALVLEYAASASPRIWHQMVMDWNWDSGLYFFEWLLNNPSTDRATALMMYWMGGPRWFKQVADRAAAQASRSVFISLKSFDFSEALEQRYCAGYFTNSQFSFDPAHDSNGYDWTREYADKPAVREIPPLLFQKLSGEIVEPPVGFTEGLPEPLYQQLEALRDEYYDE
ncbi:DUF4274 domain-containing protein [Hymenobacter terrenus]|uniref:DUF4274 domain-containing protein n=1 Tax=Hymenobacter terrenus TaxID=1629124 RepID=UPI000619F402|nr:DUF4274 domain-containing protein [Hymenobacter terrenus]